MNKELIKLAQRELSKQTPIKLKVDGVAGRETLDALLYIEQIPTEWSNVRQVVAYIQYLCAAEGINAGPIDGFWGPQTEQGAEELKVKLTGKKWFPWRKPEADGMGELVGKKWPTQTQSELEKYYGPVGKNQTSIQLPYKLTIAWNKSQKVSKITCHEKIADSTIRVLERVQDHYGARIKTLGLDLWGGTLNVRKTRGGNTWSTHAFGIAHDFDPERNKLRWSADKANFAKPEYEKWWQLWEAEGWVSLGRARDFDWMHLQAAKIRKK